VCHLALHLCVTSRYTYALPTFPSVPSSTINQPQWWLESPEEFGHEPTPRWKKPRPGKPLDVVLLLAAMIQHACFLVMNSRVDGQGTTWRQTSKHIRSTGYTQLLRVVRGEAAMNLILLSELSDIFGPVLVYSDELRLIFQTDWPLYPAG